MLDLQQARIGELRHAKYASIPEANPRLDLLRGQARFADSHTFTVTLAGGGDQRVSFDRCLIATGARPAVPPIPDVVGSRRSTIPLPDHGRRSETLCPDLHEGRRATLLLRRLNSLVTTIGAGAAGAGALNLFDKCLPPILETAFTSLGKRADDVRATWKGVIIAESGSTIVVESNHYFPADSLRRQYFSASNEHSICPWKGMASYYDVVVDGDVNAGAAWYYPEPQRAAHEIKGYVAFWRGVRVEG